MVLETGKSTRSSENYTPEDFQSVSGEEGSGDFTAERHDRARVAGEILYQSVSSATPPRSHLNSYSNYGSSYPPIGVPQTPAWVSENQTACCGLMSPVRRTFCLFVTFDFIFSFILWIIYTQVLGIKPISHAFKEEVLNYTFKTSLFDTVMCSACRMVPLLLAYALYRIKSPWVIAVTTFFTCVYLLTKVFIFDFTGKDNREGVSHDNVICYSLLIICFVMAWLETWFLDFKVLPREQKVRERDALFHPECSDRGPLLENAESRIGFPGSDMYHSLPESQQGSDDEEGGGEFQSPRSTRTHSRSASLALSLGGQEQEYLVKAQEAFEKAWEILSTNEEWKLEQGKDLDEGMVFTRNFAKLGKLFKLEAYVDATPEACFDELVNKQVESPQWNPTVSEARILQVINDNVDVCYNVATEAAGGLVSSRDFVTLRKYGKINGCLLTSGCAISHPDAPPTKKHVRGENRPGGWAFKPCPNNRRRCLLVWVINTDLKGWLPQYAVDQALSAVLLTFLQNFRTRMREQADGDRWR